MMRQHTRVLGWLLAVLAMAGFTALGLWQLQRMHAKQAMLDAQGPAVAQTLSLAQALAAPGALHGVADHGRFLPGVVLLDNQIRHGRAGVKIYRPFRSDEGSVLLVDLGWRALPPDRTLPEVPSPPSPVAVRGLLAPPPSAGLVLGPPFSATGEAGRWLASRLPAEGLAAALGLPALPERVLRLDPALPFGDERDMDLLPNTLPPQRHLGYAVQWFGLALTVLVVALVLERRRRRPSGRHYRHRLPNHEKMPHMNTATSPQARGSGRRTLVLLFAVFFGAMALAAVLRFSGWQPTGHRNAGQLLKPPVDLRQQTPTLASGQPYPWNPEARTWRLLVAPAGACDAQCVTLSQGLGKVWQLFGHNADNVEILWLGTPPASIASLPALRPLAPSPALRAALPGVDDPAGLPVYVIDPNGFVIMRHAPGSDLGGLRKDMATLLKLK